MGRPQFSHGIQNAWSLIKLEINLMQLTLQIRLQKFLKYVFLYLFSLNLGGREPYFKRGENHQRQ